MDDSNNFGQHSLSRASRAVNELLRRSQMEFHDGNGDAYRRGIRDAMSALGYTHREGVGWTRKRSSKT